MIYGRLNLRTGMYKLIINTPSRHDDNSYDNHDQRNNLTLRIQKQL
jgi:hypothetical protein